MSTNIRVQKGLGKFEAIQNGRLIRCSLTGKNGKHVQESGLVPNCEENYSKLMRLHFSQSTFPKILTWDHMYENQE